jgi:hypothetical protein
MVDAVAAFFYSGGKGIQLDKLVAKIFVIPLN